MKYLAIIKVSIFLFCFIFLNGCATLIKGTNEEVTFTSCPDNAKVFINGANLGKTPFTTELKSNKEYTVEFEKEGFENRTVMLNNSVAPGYIVLDIIFGLIPVVVDAATGSWFTLDHDHVNVILEKIEE